MSDSSQKLAEEIFLDAVEMNLNGRAEFLDVRCREDVELRRRVDELLAADDAAGQGKFLESRFIASSDVAHAAPGGEPSLGLKEGPSRFRIISRYEQGGLGEILIAHDTQLDRDVAVKQIRPKWLGHDEAKARFIQEAEVTGRLEHPGVVPVYAMGTWDDGRPFYAMRFIRGQTLKSVIAAHRESRESMDRREQSRQLRELLNRFIDVCNTIEYAHSRQVLHRDIKPSNIMVGTYGETIVVDWGLAKFLDAPVDQSMTAGFIADDSNSSGSGRTRIGGTIGTPQYMSPEQATGAHDAVGVWTDVYLLGATLYHILTGVAPHNETSVEKLVDQITQGCLTRPSALNPELSRPLEAICLKSMSTRESDRYRSAASLAADVERWLADEPVSVYRDPGSVRMGRWLRKHRSLAMSGAVAAFLITIGSVVGSSVWSYQRSRQFAVERERNATDAQLQAEKARRLDEIRGAATSAMTLSQREIEANRFVAALSILESVASTLDSQPRLQSQRTEIVERADRLRTIVEFYRQSEFCEQSNMMSRDTQGIMAATAALESLGIWVTRDWWAHLPDDDLSPEQRDQLLWDVYQQWLMLDGMLVKTIGTRLFGATENVSGRLFSAVRRLSSDAGKHEAALAMIVSDRIDEFRQAESARWYRGIARFRLGIGRKVKAADIETPRNAGDAQKLGVMCLLSAMDPSFRVVFHDYKHQDPITAGRDLFQRSASLRPNHYWTQLGLAQMQYFAAEQDPQATWASYQPAVQTMGRCIAINPNSCFAVADRSSLFRFQSELIEMDESLAEDFRHERAAELLKWSLQDAQTAYRLSSDQPWVGWTYGMALGAAEQTDQAIKVLMKASLQTLPLMRVKDATLINADDIRGRKSAAEYAARLVQQHPKDPIHHTLLASICLNQQRYDESRAHVDLALHQPTPPAHAYAIRGMLMLERDNVSAAAEDFRHALLMDSEHLWAKYGLATCEDAQAKYNLALAGFEASMPLATTDEHRSACALSLGRVLAWKGDYVRAMKSLKLAQQLQPACDLFAAVEPLIERFKQMRSESGATEALIAMQQFLQSVGQLPRVTKISLDDSLQVASYTAPILNGDFELGAMRYWSDPNGAAWRNSTGYSASAEISRLHAHTGNYSLHIVGDLRASDSSNSVASRGSTSQTFPVPANSRCRLSLWHKASGLQPKALQLEMGQEVVLDIPQGDYDWRKSQIEFEVGEVRDPSLTVVSLDLDVVSSGKGEAWLDDVELTVISD